MSVCGRTIIVVLAIVAMPLAVSEPIKTDGSKIGITIMGAIVQKDTDNNVALIKDSKGKVQAVKKGHVILDKYKVIHITGKFIELITRDKQEYLVYQNKFAEEFATRERKPLGPRLLGAADQYREDGFERDKGNIRMTAMYRDKLVKQDLARVLMQATAEPHMENGQIIGFKLSQIDEGSIYDKSGIRNDDVITSINNHSLNSVAGAIALLRSLKATENISVEIVRGGEKLDFSISVEN